jgi:hypothetical protein
MTPPTEQPPPSLTFTGQPVNWHGRSFTWDEWAKLGSWERYGPNGRLWSGLTQSWVTEAEHEAAVAVARAEGRLPEHWGRG